MHRSLILLFAMFVTVSIAADEQLTIHKVTITTPSGAINGKVVGTGDKLVFIDDANPSNSFTLSRGQVQQFRTENNSIVVEMARPSTDASGTVSNLRITVVDPSNTTTLTKWLSMPQERARTVTTYTTDVRHKHGEDGHCNGKLIADDTTLRFESVSEASHSRSWNYNDLRSFEKEKEYSPLKVTPNGGETVEFNTVNGKTAGALYDIVAQKIVAARPVNP